jgi:hypothetical protein
LFEAVVVKIYPPVPEPLALGLNCRDVRMPEYEETYRLTAAAEVASSPSETCCKRMSANGFCEDRRLEYVNERREEESRDKSRMGKYTILSFEVVDRPSCSN